jgi:hypothetical protein
MELLFTVIKYLFLGIFGLVALLIVLTILFGKKVTKHWEYEAKFMDSGRERGEFDVKFYRLEGEDEDRLDIKCTLRDPRLKKAMSMEMFLDDKRVLKGIVEKDGKLFLGSDALVTEFTEPSAGQRCELKHDGRAWYSGELYVD